MPCEAMVPLFVHLDSIVQLKNTFLEFKHDSNLFDDKRIQSAPASSSSHEQAVAAFIRGEGQQEEEGQPYSDYSDYSATLTTSTGGGSSQYNDYSKWISCSGNTCSIRRGKDTEPAINTVTGRAAAIANPAPPLTESGSDDSGEDEEDEYLPKLALQRSLADEREPGHSLSHAGTVEGNMEDEDDDAQKILLKTVPVAMAGPQLAECPAMDLPPRQVLPTAESVGTAKQCSAEPMTSIQEVCNALSMLGPSLVVLFKWLYPPMPDYWSRHTAIFSSGSLLHLPFSVSLHLQLALGLAHDYGCRARVLDQTFVHVNCLCIAYATSGSVFYLCCCGLFHAWAMHCIWNSKSTMLQRTCNVCIGIFSYCIPMVVRGDHWNFACCLGLFLVGLATYVVGAFADVGAGWTHCIFHLVLTPGAACVMDSASKVQFGM
jgi:hypothetical protein